MTCTSEEKTSEKEGMLTQFVINVYAHVLCSNEV